MVMMCNSVYLFDDKIIIDCNYKDGTETITLEEIENSALSSDLTLLGAPKKRKGSTTVGLFLFLFGGSRTLPNHFIY